MKRGLYKTDIERIMQRALKKEKIKVVYNFPIRSKYGYIIDFAIPDKKIVIECDGEVWHKLGNQRDRKRDAVLRKLGWEVLRFRGQEILNNINNCIQKINLKLIERR